MLAKHGKARMFELHTPRRSVYSPYADVPLNNANICFYELAPHKVANKGGQANLKGCLTTRRRCTTQTAHNQAREHKPPQGTAAGAAE